MLADIRYWENDATNKRYAIAHFNVWNAEMLMGVIDAAEEAKSPVIGIGEGNVTDGQILVMHDAFGITGGHIPKFAKNFLAETGDIRAAVRQYMAEVESGVYPGEEHSFH